MRQTLDSNDFKREPTPWGVIVPVAVVAALFHAWVAACSRAWVTPDSGEYIRLAAGVVERFDLRDDLFQFRTPGYPLLLATLFRLFGPASPEALVWLQHGMAAACAVVASMIAWCIWPQRVLAVLAGLFTAMSMPLAGYANAALAEVPFTLALSAALLFVLRFTNDPRARHLAMASLLLGSSILLKPGGQLLLYLSIVVVVILTLLRREYHHVLKRLVAATLPAVILTAPFAIQNGLAHGRYALSCQGGLLWYYRAACVDLLESSSSPAFARVLVALETSRQNGWTGPGTRPHHFNPVLHACRRAYDMSMSEASELMGAAGKELAMENRAAFLHNSLAYARRIILAPDNAHRMVAGGAPGEEGKLAPAAGLYAADSFLSFAAYEAGHATMLRYFPVGSSPPAGAGTWQAFVRWLHEHIEISRFPAGWSTTPYEWLAWMSCLGGVLLVTLRRSLAAIVISVVAFAYVAVPAFFAGVAPRTITPARPILCLFLAATLVYCFAACRILLAQWTSSVATATSTP